ncbi:hypothetical protein TSC_c06760 [Thermus scotoductus SA-01]|uniref:Uncharacterized protein n=1 Tax=Thermus scotoductus (strain ATCC 700910 / SA-01) TaxID=743525 RepID=E8PMM7_THESS|nr:hypothetical protein TSC_c06760 [Thermus scotoductus SA-01]
MAVEPPERGHLEAARPPQCFLEHFYAQPVYQPVYHPGNGRLSE